jgi:hypothetical protein
MGSWFDVPPFAGLETFGSSDFLMGDWAAE